MTRKSKRELERALEGLDKPADPGEPCEECGGLPEGADVEAGLTAEFVTVECTCDRDLPEEATTISPSDTFAGEGGT